MTLRLYSCLLLLLSTLATSLCAQPQERIYLLAGQGSDHRIFSELTFDSAYYDVLFLDFHVPSNNTSMHEYAAQFIPRIDTTLPYSFVGVSLGGMVSVELTDLLAPRHTVLLSSAKHRGEIPLSYRTQRFIPLYRIVPSSWMKASAFIVQPLFEPDRKSHKDTFVSMLKDKDKRFLKRATGLIVKWDRMDVPSSIIHIHGDNDHTLPIRRINADITVEDGSHMMTLTRADEIQHHLDAIFQGD